LLKRQELGLGEFEEKKDTRTPEQIASDKAKAEGVRLENERKQQVIDKGNQPNATPRDKKISEFESNAKEGVEAGILEPWEVEAQRKDFYGKPPPFGYSSWVEAGEQGADSPPPKGEEPTAAEGKEAPAASAFDSSSLSGENKAAYDWAIANPRDPKAAKILSKLGAK
jgi:hypothetical protein